MRNCLMLAVSAACLAGCDVSFSAGNVSVGQVKGNVSTSAGEATRRFVNSRDNARSASLQQYYVDFAFDYPSHWVVSPQANDGTAQNYVRVQAPFIDGFEPFAVHVGYAYGSGDAEADRRDLEATLPQFAEQFGRSFQNYRIVSLGTDQVAGQETLNWRFTATAPGVNGGAPAQVFGRGDVLLPPGATRGVSIVSIATSRTNEVARAEDVGESGTLAAVLDSFRLGGGGQAAGGGDK